MGTGMSQFQQSLLETLVKPNRHCESVLGIGLLKNFGLATGEMHEKLDAYGYHAVLMQPPVIGVHDELYI